MKDDDFYLDGDNDDDSATSIADLGAEHWQEEIEFLEQRLRGDQGEIDKDDRDTCLEALAIAKDNLAVALKN
jgi:hypothetical protein